MTHCNCHVCMSDFPVAKFRRLACGHCYCMTCVAQIQHTQQGKARCPECRTPISSNDPQPIYIDIVGVKPLATTVAEGVGRMGADAKVVSVRTAARKLQQVAEEEGKKQAEDRYALDGLLAAITDFSERIVPVFVTAKSQETEIARLKRQLQEAEALRLQAERATMLSGEVAMLRAEVLQLRTSLQKSNEESDLAVRLAGDAAVELQQARREKDESEVRSEREIRRLKGLLERNADDRNKEKQKMAGIWRERDALLQQVGTLEQQVEDKRREIRELCGDDLGVDLQEDQTFESEFSSPRRASGPSSDVSPEMELEVIPQAGFKSDWRLGRGTNLKRKERNEVSAGFPIAMRNGRPKVAIQLGPKRTRRVQVVKY